MHRSPLPALLLLLLAVHSVRAALPRSTPEAQGLSSAGLTELVNELDAKVHEMHSLMIVRHGQVVAEGWWAPYAAEHNHVLYSLSKSFTSTAIGFAIAEGKLDLFDPVIGFFPEDEPAEPSARLKAMRVRDLLTMSTGHQDEPPREPGTVSPKSFLAHPVPHKPGSHFLYNTPATFMLSAIVQKVSGETALDYLRPRLFEPLGITQPVWDTNTAGVTLGGYGLRVRTEDIASFGQLYLQRGHWQGRQLLPASWIDLATSRQMSNGSNPQSDWDQGYGFQFWRCRFDAYRADGAFGQYCVVLPEHDMVVVITSGTRDLQAVLNHLWEKLLPLPEAHALPANEAAVATLRQTLGRLALRQPEGTLTSPRAKDVYNRTFASTSANGTGAESLTLLPDANGGGLKLVFRANGREHTYPFGYQEWHYGRGPVSAGALASLPDEPVAGTFAWEDDRTLVLKVAAYETPFAMTHRLTFKDDEVTIATEANVAFGPTKQPVWIARAPAR